MNSPAPMNAVRQAAVPRASIRMADGGMPSTVCAKKATMSATATALIKAMLPRVEYLIARICAPAPAFASPERCHNQTDPPPAPAATAAIEVHAEADRASSDPAPALLKSASEIQNPP